MNKKGIGQLAIIAIILVVLFLLNLVGWSVLMSKVSESPWLIAILFVFIYLILRGNKKK